MIMLATTREGMQIEFQANLQAFIKDPSEENFIAQQKLRDEIERITWNIAEITERQRDTS